ncbi:MAG: hypothetical protein H6811_01445 [Phycisphaeraceae bacterium]|nr:hypothetical protein [Phycisphaeraceae bacterium]
MDSPIRLRRSVRTRVVTEVDGVVSDTGWVEGENGTSSGFEAFKESVLGDLRAHAGLTDDPALREVLDRLNFEVEAAPALGGHTEWIETMTTHAPRTGAGPTRRGGTFRRLMFMVVGMVALLLLADVTVLAGHSVLSRTIRCRPVGEHTVTLEAGRDYSLHISRSAVRTGGAAVAWELTDARGVVLSSHEETHAHAGTRMGRFSVGETGPVTLRVWSPRDRDETFRVRIRRGDRAVLTPLLTRLAW